MVAEIGPAFGVVELADALLQRLGQAAKLGAEHTLLGQHHLAEPATAQAQYAHRGIRPVEQKDPHLGPVEEPGPELFLGDGSAVEHPFDVEIVDAHRGIIADRRPRVRTARPVDLTVQLQIPIVVGEAEHRPVRPGDPPAGGERRHLAGEMLGECWRSRVHSRSSTTGICPQVPSW
jgi:hypothetical protein